jgi:glycosyltransferase involved in cell wall biosynthesis
MKIGIEAQRVLRKVKKGMDIVAIQLIRSLQKIDTINQYYIFVNDDEGESPIQETSNFKIIKLKKAPYPYWEQVILPGAVKEYGIELLHCTNNTAPLNITVPLLLTLHDIIYLESINFTKGSWYQIFGNFYRRWNVPIIVKKTAKIITVSEYERKNIVDYFRLSPDHVQTIYNGVGENFYKVRDEGVLSSIKKKYNLPEDYVFYLGNTDPRKNIKGVMKALAWLRKNNMLSFSLVMPGVDHTFLREVASGVGDPEILNSILLPGYIPDDDLAAIYSMARVFLFPSLREGFGLPILEAMACGVPVITSNTSSMPEVAGNASLLIDPDNEEEIASAILKLLKDSLLRRELINKGFERSSAFSWENNARKTLSLYKSVISELRTYS